MPFQAAFGNGSLKSFGLQSSRTVYSNTVFDYLVVGGGGGGGAADVAAPPPPAFGGGGEGGGGGGGGAGGLRQGSGLGFQLGGGFVCTVTVGAGGVGAAGQFSPVTNTMPANYGVRGDNGQDSSITAPSSWNIVAFGGGGGGTALGGNVNGASGGSGGGAASSPIIGPGGTGNSGGAGTPGQGNDGSAGSGPVGVGNQAAAGTGGGGGGAGGTATSGTDFYGPATFLPWNGGVGLSSSISGTPVFYAGGGGGGGNIDTGNGGAGGSGIGGGGGSVDGFATYRGGNAVANRGSGGGGGGAGQSVNEGGSGSSGIVIIRHRSNLPTANTTGSPTFSDNGTYKTYTFTGSGSLSFGTTL